MQTALQFGPILVHLDRLLLGLVQTIQLAVLSISSAQPSACSGAVGRRFGPRWLAWPIAAYVELIRNTPLLIQLYFVFFSLPLFGFKLSSNTAAVVALSIHLGAYATEILRAGIDSIPEGQIEAAKSLGLSRYRIIRHVILVPAVRAVYPSLSAQFILQIMGTSIVGRDRRGGIDRDRQQPRHADIPQLRSLHHHRRHLFRRWSRPRASSSPALASSCSAGSLDP